ncbi:Aste57867_324 [Aphanomyces stellatus]|uniref:Aste57867_324 protein n=1 Tax=Aphanomyces stellatus TaxID=120398 RepID=A0A485K2B4_9STRA|nr:hypothetical protein As57867_000324 [Aphanomyces stellatus]VFT77550.1 Aste57867_324 [Aphanomyces stellatus]
MANSRKNSASSDFSLDSEQRYRRQCQSLLTCAVSTPFTEAVTRQEDGWSLRHEKEGFKVFRKYLADKELDKYVCTGVLKTNLASFTRGLHADTTDDHRILSSILYEGEFIDAKVVRVFETKDADDSFKFSGLKYLKTKMPVQSAHATRDAIYYEFSGCRRKHDGTRYLFVVQDAVKLTSVPPQKNIARESITMVYLFCELPDGHVQCTMQSYVVPNGIIPTWFYAFSYWQTAVRLTALPDIRFLVSGDKLLGTVPWVPDSARKSCIVCSKKFNPLRSRHHCRACGDIMCNACSVRIAYTPRYLQSEPSKNAMQEHKICQKCMINAKQELSRSPVTADGESAIQTCMGSPSFRLRTMKSDASLIEEAKSLLRGESRSAPSVRSSHEPLGRRRKGGSLDESVLATTAAAVAPYPLNFNTTSTQQEEQLEKQISDGFIVCKFNGGELEGVRTSDVELAISPPHPGF